MPWENPTLDTDEDGIIGRILDGIADRLEGWEPVEGAPEVALAEEIGRQIAATNALTIEALQVAIAGIGETVFGLPARIGAAAIIPQVDIRLGVAGPQVTVGGVNGAYATLTIPAGFTIIVDGVAFETTEDLVVDNEFFPITGDNYGLRYTKLFSVPMTAQQQGTVGNVSIDEPVVVVTATSNVVLVELDSNGSGGVDEESLVGYLDRLTTYLSTLRPGGVRAEDLAAFARTFDGVHRAIGFDLYDASYPEGQRTGHERTATIIAITANGDPVTGAARSALQARLDAAREVNFRVILGPPTYSAIHLAVTITPAIGSDPETVRVAVADRLAGLIDPGAWGSTTDDPTAWVERAHLSVLDIAAVVGQVPGVGTISTATVNGASAVDIPGPGALPTPMDDLTNPSTVAVTIA